MHRGQSKIFIPVRIRSAVLLACFRLACAAAITVLVITNLAILVRSDLPFSQPLTFLTFFAYLWKFLATHLLYLCHLLSYTYFLFQNVLIKVTPKNTVEPQLTATSLQRPLFVVDSPYIDSCLNFSKMATFPAQRLVLISFAKTNQEKPLGPGYFLRSVASKPATQLTSDANDFINA